MATTLAPPPQMPVPQNTQAAPKDPTAESPSTLTGEQVAQQQGLEPDLQAALISLRTTFKQRYQPKRTVFVRETMRSFQALRGNTFALLNDRNAALDTINELMQGLVDGGDDPSLHDHNENVYQMFCLSFIAALMVNLGKVRYQPADADDEEDLEIAKKASIIQAFNERLNDEDALNQLKLLYLWTSGSYWRYVRHTIDSQRAGSSYEPDIKMQSIPISEDGHLCPQCGGFTPDSSLHAFSSGNQCASCGSALQQKDWYEGQSMDLPVQVGEIETANGMTAFDIVNGLMVDANPDAMDLKDTEILDYSVDCSASKVRSAFPEMYSQITPLTGTDAGSDDAARMARQEQTTPGSNSKPITAEGLVTYSRCWFQSWAFYELEDKTLADRLKAKFPKGCKLTLCGADTFLDACEEPLMDHWTWCGTIKGLGLYPFSVGKCVLDIQERITDVVNIEHAYLARLAFGTILYDADFIDGNAIASRVLTPGNMTPVSRTDEETGGSKALSDLMFQPEFRIDPEIFKQSERLTARAQLLAGIMPQIFGGSDPNVQTKGGQQQALSTALGRLTQFVNQMRGENARCARISVKCSVENMDEELKIVEQGEMANSYETVKLLKAELNGDFFTYPEMAEGFPSTYEQIQSRVMQLLTSKNPVPALAQMLADPDNAATVARYVLPDQMTLPGDEQRAKVKKVLNRLAQSKAIVQQGSKGPVAIPSIQPEPGVDDPEACAKLAKKWLLKNYDQIETNPNGYANVLAYLKLCTQMAQEQAAQAAINMQAAQAQHGGQGAPQGS
jgi:hypothetical protein